MSIGPDDEGPETWCQCHDTPECPLCPGCVYPVCDGPNEKPWPVGRCVCKEEA